MSDKIYPDMADITVSVDGVFKLLHSIKVSKAAGPDQLPNRSLKMAAKQIAPILASIFQQSLDSWSLPTDWKWATLTPLFKKGSHSNPANYRPDITDFNLL